VLLAVLLLLAVLCHMNNNPLWEQDDVSGVIASSSRNRPAWEQEDYDASSTGVPHIADGSDIDDEDDDEPTPGAKFVSHMTNLYMCRHIFAEDLCVAMHHAKDQIVEAKPLAKPPVLSSGKYNQHLKSVLHYTADNPLLYDLSFPCKLKGTVDRSSNSTFAIPAHELIQEDWESNHDDQSVRLQEMIERRGLPPSYFDHPLVREHGGHFARAPFGDLH
jgi:hypothetical protein